MSAGGWGAALKVGGEYLKYKAQRDGYNRGESVRGVGKAEVDKRNEAIMQGVIEGAGQYNATDRLDKKNQMAADKEAQLLAALEQAGGTIDPTQGKMSKEYLQQRAQRLVDEATKAATRARLNAKVQTPGNLQFAEGINNAQNRSDMNVRSTNRNDYWRAILADIERATRPNEKEMLYGSIMSGIGGGMMMGG